jgi:hypothetical protein
VTYTLINNGDSKYAAFTEMTREKMKRKTQWNTHFSHLDFVGFKTHSENLICSYRHTLTCWYYDAPRAHLSGSTRFFFSLLSINVEKPLPSFHFVIHKNKCYEYVARFVGFERLQYCLITRTNLIHFSSTFTLLKLKASTCFGYHLPILRRHYTNTVLVDVACCK